MVTDPNYYVSQHQQLLNYYLSQHQQPLWEAELRRRGSPVRRRTRRTWSVARMRTWWAARMITRRPVDDLAVRQASPVDRPDLPGVAT